MRKLLLALMVIAAVGVTLWLVWPRTAITRANAAKITEGMTSAEVEAILGPPRDETTGPIELDAEAEGALLTRWIAFMVVEPAGGRRAMWHSDQVVIWVQWNEGCVAVCDHFPIRRRAESPLDRVRRWLRL